MVRGWIEELVTQKVVRWRRTKGGSPVLEVINFSKHQKIDKKSKSKIRPQLEPIDGDAPPEEESPEAPPQRELNLPAGPPTPRVPLGEFSRDSREGLPDGSGSGAGSLRFDHGSGAGSSSLRSHVDSVDNSPEERQRVTDEFVAEFYAWASPGRQVDVREQLLQAFSRNGARYGDRPVFAAGPVHVRRCLMALRDKPPKDPDAAIVFLFLKLQDTYTEAMSEQCRREEGVAARRSHVGEA
jgi:hypothetical protein